MRSAAVPEAGTGSQPDHPGLLPSALLGATPAGGSPGRSPRDWAVDVICFGLAAGLGVLTFASSEDLGAVPPWLAAADFLLGLTACVGLWWRRRWPVQFAMAMVPLTVFSAMAAIAGMIALFTVAVHRRSSIVAGIAALHSCAGIAYTLWVRPETTLPWWALVLIQVLVTVVLVAWGMFVRVRRQLVLSLRERARRAEAEQQLRVDQARQLERTRIAREMHDVLAHRISLVSVQAGALELRSAALPPDVATTAGIIRESAHEALQDLREILGVLRAEVAAEDLERPQPTLADLPRLIDESRRGGMRVLASGIVAQARSVPVSIGRTAYRVAQEGLTNARKHAPGAEVTLRLSGGAGAGLTVEVTSRLPVGPPIEFAIPGAGLGLAGLAERVGLVGGRLEHGHTPNGDFRLTAWLPWPA